MFDMSEQLKILTVLMCGIIVLVIVVCIFHYEGSKKQGYFDCVKTLKSGDACRER